MKGARSGVDVLRHHTYLSYDLYLVIWWETSDLSIECSEKIPGQEHENCRHREIGTMIPQIIDI